MVSQAENKKTDVDERPGMFVHVGLLFNAPPGHRAPSCSLSSHPTNSNPLCQQVARNSPPPATHPNYTARKEKHKVALPNGGAQAQYDHIHGLLRPYAHLLHGFVLYDVTLSATGMRGRRRCTAFVMDDIDESAKSRISAAAWPNLSPSACLHRSVLGPAPVCPESLIAGKSADNSQFLKSRDNRPSRDVRDKRSWQQASNPPLARDLR